MWSSKKIDFILHSQEFQITKVFSEVNAVEKYEYGCPNELCPSDHLYIYSEMSLKD